MLILERLAFRYPSQTRGYCFSMQAKPGEVTAVSGPSGSGKSTLFDLLAGFLAPQGGVLTLDGRDLVPLRPEQRPVSILLQSETLFEHLSAAANIALGLPGKTGKAARQAAINGALEKVGLAGFGPQRASTLSGGQNQRVALARTLLRNRPVLLLDEPFSALDDATRATVRTLVADLTKANNWTTVLVSHHADDVAALARRHYAIHDGELVEDKALFS